MNCCWILLLLLCCGRGCCGTMDSRTLGGSCGCGRERRGGGRRREECENERTRDACDGGRKEKAERSDCGCAEMRAERETGSVDSCDVVNTIPPTWQEYAKRDTDGCKN